MYRRRFHITIDRYLQNKKNVQNSNRKFFCFVLEIFIYSSYWIMVLFFHCDNRFDDEQNNWVDDGQKKNSNPLIIIIVHIVLVGIFLFFFCFSHYTQFILITIPLSHYTFSIFFFLFCYSNSFRLLKLMRLVKWF